MQDNEVPAGIDLVVVGDCLLDVWLHGRQRRVSREGGAPVVEIGHRATSIGGAGRVAVHAGRLGARVRLVSVIGDDHAADELCSHLSSEGIDLSGIVRDKTRSTITKVRVLDRGVLTSRTDSGSRTPPPEPTLDLLAGAVGDCLEKGIPIVVSDYGLGSAGEHLRGRLRDPASRYLALAADCRDAVMLSMWRPQIATPSWDELVAAELVPQHLDARGRPSLIADRSKQLRDHLGCDNLAVTLDRDGAVLLHGGDVEHITNDEVHDGLGTGAGDAFLAGVAVGLCGGATQPQAVKSGVQVAAASLKTFNPADVTHVPEVMLGAAERKGAVLTNRRAAEIANALRVSGRRIVFTNGCFDLLHPGHVASLRAARALGNVLIVAVNDDASVRALKGASRPLMPVRDRAAVVAALDCVDYVTVLSGLTASTLLESIRPHVYAKGGDYEPEVLPEWRSAQAVGAEVVIVPRVGEYSTTRTIELIDRRLDGRQHVADGQAVQGRLG